ncbi:MAG: hypothetical protein QGG40_18390, partial [Myxococcota bacterium]|nr:hypothetical protein [Myxococcota bacterium]
KTAEEATLRAVKLGPKQRHEKSTGTAVLLGNRSSPTSSLACSPPLQAGPVDVRLRWRTMVLGKTRKPTWIRVEGRSFDTPQADARVPAFHTERLLSTRKNQPWKSERFRFSPPARATSTRICVLVAGESAGEVWWDLLEIGPAAD